MNLNNSSTVVQLLRYGVVGVIAFIVDFGGLWVLTEFIGIPYLWSAAISFILGLITNYLLSTIWVFKEKRFDIYWLEFLIFTVIGVIGLAFNEVIIYVSTDLLGFYYLIGKTVSTIMVFFWNFFARKVVLFQK